LFPLISHELLHALAFSTRIIVTISFQEVDGTPDTQASAQGDHEGLENFDCAIEKIHIVVAGTYGSSKKIVLRIAKAGMKTAYAAPDSGISFQILMVVLHPDFAKRVGVLCLPSLYQASYLDLNL